jgi:hypothetical protein
MIMHTQVAIVSELFLPMLQQHGADLLGRPLSLSRTPEPSRVPQPGRPTEPSRPPSPSREQPRPARQD